jgi:hypothetical protein
VYLSSFTHTYVMVDEFVHYLLDSEKTAGEAPLIRSRHKDGNTIHAVAYSEHSSFNELVQFVSIFKYVLNRISNLCKLMKLSYVNFISLF